jgi:sugar O-acyltransferase (sialic acid O-acetyltransferase NeuD family)
MTKATLFVFGSRSTAIEIAEAAVATTAFHTVVMVGDQPPANTKFESVTDPQLEFHPQLRSAHYITSMSDPGIRQRCQKLAERLELTPARIIHPLAYVSPSAVVGTDVYVAATAVISSSAVIANHVIINFGVVVGHDSMIGTNTSLCPGVKVSGNVRIGNDCFVGSNAFLLQYVRVGDRCSIDALTYVPHDLEDDHVGSSRSFRSFRRPNKS